MKRLLALAFCGWLAGVAGALAATQVNDTIPSGQYPGTATNDSATAGNIGEVVAVNVTTGTATVTITIASPGVVSWTSHGLGCGGAVNFTTTGALPTGLSVGTTYYITCGASLLTNSFQVSTSVANAIAGTSVNTSGTQSGTHTGLSSATLSTGVTNDVAGVSLTAGQWQCSGSVYFNPAGTTTMSALLTGINTVSASLPNVGATDSRTEVRGNIGAGLFQTHSLAPTSFKLSATTTLFLSANSTFATSTMAAAGRLECVRQR